MNQQNRNEQRNNNGWSWSKIAGTMAGAVGVVGASILAYNWLNKTEDSTTNENERPRRNRISPVQAADTSTCRESRFASFVSALSGLTMTPTTKYENSRASVPRRPQVTNLNSLLHDVHVRYLQLKSEDRIYYDVFCDVFRQLQENMKKVDPYYNKYSSRKQFAGSHYDSLRIKKPDEFDMDIVIGLPLNFDLDPYDSTKSDIILESTSPGFVQLKMGKQFQTLYKRDGIDFLVNKTAYEWADESGYLLRSKFTDWFVSVVTRALNELPHNGGSRWTVFSQGKMYTISLSSSGPATTFYVTAPGFKLDVDFVPALKFPEKRWPVSKRCRQIPLGCNREDWMVVPKRNKSAPAYGQSRFWRIALHDQEKQMMKNCNNLKLIIKLMKQLRDAQGMDKIASYYIKTLFFWEMDERGYSSDFWTTRSPAELFIYMVKKLHSALLKGEIPYFWDKTNNLIGGAPSSTISCYTRKIGKLVDVLDCEPNNYKAVAKFLLGSDYDEYERLLN